MLACQSGVWAKQGGGGLGVGQTWQNVSASRALGVTYTNTTSKPIVVSITATAQNYCILYLTINSVVLGPSWSGGAGYSQTPTIGGIVPAGQTYSAEATNCPLHAWNELR